MVRNTSFESDRKCITCKFRKETEKAYLVELEDGQLVWFPKSQAEVYPNEDGTHDLFATEWILDQKGIDYD